MSHPTRMGLKQFCGYSFTECLAITFYMVSTLYVVFFV